MSLKANVIALAKLLSASQQDDVAVNQDYDDVLLSLDPTEMLMAVTLVPQDHEAVLSVPGEAIRILAVWYDERQLAMADRIQLEATTPHWRDDRGTPRAFVVETEGDRQFRLWPRPDAKSKDFSFPNGLPYGVDFPVYTVSVAYTETRRGVPDYLDLPMAMAMLARDFARESRHRDPAFSVACRKIADRTLQMVAA